MQTFDEAKLAIHSDVVLTCTAPWNSMTDSGLVVDAVRSEGSAFGRKEKGCASLRSCEGV